MRTSLFQGVLPMFFIALDFVAQRCAKEFGERLHQRVFDGICLDMFGPCRAMPHSWGKEGDGRLVRGHHPGGFSRLHEASLGPARRPRPRFHQTRWESELNVEFGSRLPPSPQRILELYAFLCTSAG